MNSEVLRSSNVELSGVRGQYDRLSSIASIDQPEEQLETSFNGPSVTRSTMAASAPDESNVTTTDLSISTLGESLKFTTRNVPTRPPGHQASPDGGDSAVRIDDLLPEEITEMYAEVGRTLASPKVLSGLMNLVALFTKRAGALPHFYTNRYIRVGMVVGILSFITAVPLKILYEDIDKTTSLYFFIPMFGPLFLVLIVFLVWTLLPACTGKLLLRSRLEALEPFMELCQISNQEYSQLFHETDSGGVCDYKVVGSAGDGFGFFASEGSNKVPIDTQPIIKQDIDLNIIMNNLSVKAENIRGIPGTPGFTWVIANDIELVNIRDPIIRQCLVPVPIAGSTEFYLSGDMLNREMFKFFELARANSATSRLVQSFPALTLQTQASGPNGQQMYEVDFAFALRYPCWPEEAREWITRERYGVDLRTVNNIANRGCYLVHKPCDHVTSPPHAHGYDWRFTFAAAEADLFHYHSDKKALKLAYITLKFLIKLTTGNKGGAVGTFCYASLSDLFGRGAVSSPVLRTYTLKTIFLWMAEEETELDYYTVKGNRDIGEVLMAMINRYCTCLEQKNLPNYFIRHRNMLNPERYTDRDFSSGLKVLKGIRRHPALSMKKFEQNFVNKRQLIMIIVGLCVIAGVAFLGQIISQAVSRQLYTESNQLLFDAFSDIDTKYFTQRYMNFLEDLLYGNKTTNGTMTNTTAVNRTGI